MLDIHSAEARQESCGAHIHEGFPDRKGVNSMRHTLSCTDKSQEAIYLALRSFMLNVNKQKEEAETCGARHEGDTRRSTTSQTRTAEWSGGCLMGAFGCIPMVLPRGVWPTLAATTQREDFGCIPRHRP